MKNLKYIKNVSTLVFDKEKCTGCRVCTFVCPHRVFKISEKKAEITDVNLCIECGACVKNCPSGAIRVNPGVG